MFSKCVLKHRKMTPAVTKANNWLINPSPPDATINAMAHAADAKYPAG